MVKRRGGGEKSRQPEGGSAIATIDEVQAAVEDLSVADLLRLEKFARWRVRGLGRRAHGRDHEDLRQEAMVSTLAGDRHWNKAAVDFVGHLLGAMRSISTHWGEQADRDEALLEAELITTTPEGTERNPLTEAPIPDPPVDEVVSTREQLREIRQLFEGDVVVGLILECMAEGMSGAETQQYVGISAKDYETARKRMVRTVRRKLSGGSDV